MDVIVTSPEGDKKASTDPVAVTPKQEVDALVPRRVSPADINGNVGQFLAEVLPLLAPDVYNAANWRGKLTMEVVSNQSSFLCCGRAVGLANVERRAMYPLIPSVRVKWLVVDVEGGGTKEDSYEILRAMKRWARGMNGELVLPDQEMTNVPLGKMKDIMKAKERTEYVVSAIEK